MVMISMKRTVMLLFMAVLGMISTRCGLINKEKSKGMSDIIMYVLTPAMVISSMQKDFDLLHLKGLLLTFLASVAGYLLNILLVKFVIRSKNKDDKSVLEFCAVYSNVGYMGIPLVASVLGSEGVFYLTGSIAALNIIVFTCGVLQMRKGDEAISVKAILCHPCVLSVFVGIAMFCLGIRLPELLSEPVSMLGDAVTPMAMLVAGYSIANSDFKDRSHDAEMAWTIFWRLLVFPAIFVFVMHLLPGINMAKMAAIIAMACPTATLTVFFAVKYDRNDALASQVFSISTILSVVTIPAVIWLAELLGIVV